MSTENNFALVTGTSSGIGAEVASRLLDRGWTVIGASRRDAPISNARYEHLYIDLGDLPALVRAAEERVAPVLRDRTWSRVALVNNAAVASLLAPLHDVDPVKLMELYAVNSAAPFWLMGFVSRCAPRAAALRIVNVSSGAAAEGLPGLAAYGSSKAALRLAGMALAQEWRSAAPAASAAIARRNAAILSYEPGVVDTPMQQTARDTSVDAFPWVSMFQNFHYSGMLVEPALPAADIVDFLESNDQPAFAERRFQPR